MSSQLQVCVCCQEPGHNPTIEEQQCIIALYLEEISNMGTKLAFLQCCTRPAELTWIQIRAYRLIRAVYSVYYKFFKSYAITPAHEILFPPEEELDCKQMASIILDGVIFINDCTPDFIDLVEFWRNQESGLPNVEKCFYYVCRSFNALTKFLTKFHPAMCSVCG